MKSSGDIFQYEDFRLFLKDTLATLKRNSKTVSFRSLSKKGGFSSPNFIKLVMDGGRDLTLTSLEQVCLAFELKGLARDYFKELVGYQQSKNSTLRFEHYSNMMKLRLMKNIKHLEAAQFQFLSDWYMVALREMIGLAMFVEDYRWISKKFGNAISPLEAKKKMNMLLDLGLVERDKSGKLRVKDTTISTGDEARSLALSKLHEELLKKAIRSLSEVHESKRDISGLMIPLPKSKIHEVKKLIQRFRKELLAEISNYDDSASQIYQINMQLFPLLEESV